MSKPIITEISDEDGLYEIREDYLGKEIIPCKDVEKWGNNSFFGNKLNGFMSGHFIVDGRETCFFAVKYGKGK